MKNTRFILILLIICTGMRPTAKKSTLPPGFVWVAGKENMGPFIISENPVSNYEYLLYTEWLRKVFIDYPEIYLGAKPKSQDPGILYPHNDPYSSSYFGHPAYADYPVVGINWTQAMEYCSWKTDRLNEAILVETGGMDWQKQLSTSWDENNFNTEAFINGQYWFSEMPKKNQEYFRFRKSKDGKQWERIYDDYSASKINSPDFYPGLVYGGRLPTEEEWDYFMSGKYNSQTKWFAEASYGEMAKYLNINPGMVQEYGKNRNHPAVYQKVIREWMLDTFTEKPATYPNLQSRLGAGAFPISNIELHFRDEYGSLREKDSAGRFGFRIFDWDPSGQAICSWRYGYRMYNYLYETLEKPSVGFSDSVLAIYKSNKLDSLREVYKGYIPYNQVGVGCSWTGYVVFFNIGNKVYQLVMPYPFVSAEADEDFIKTKAVYLFNIHTDCTGCEELGGRNRITKSKEKRLSETEIHGQNDLGFRVLIPWHGQTKPQVFHW